MKKSIIFLFTFLTFATVGSAQIVQHIVVKLLDGAGNPIPTGQVAAILKSGAYQDAKFDAGEYKCDPTEKCIKIFAGAAGFEAAVKKYPGTAGTVTIVMKPSPTKSSVIVHRRSPLPGIEGDVNPILDSQERMYIYATKIGLLQNGRPAQQPLPFKLNRPIDAASSTGEKFTIWVMDITQEVSVLEFTQPK